MVQNGASKMQLLRQLGNIFTGKSYSTDDVGYYYYVRCNRCGEVIRVRINPMNDLSAKDDGEGWFTRKMIVGSRCYNRIEAEFNYDSKRKLINSQISGGTLVDKEAYEAEQQAHPDNPGT
jgi:hypothetical protein